MKYLGKLRAGHMMVLAQADLGAVVLPTNESLDEQTYITELVDWGYLRVGSPRRPEITASMTLTTYGKALLEGLLTTANLMRELPKPGYIATPATAAKRRAEG